MARPGRRNREIRLINEQLGMPMASRTSLGLKMVAFTSLLMLYAAKAINAWTCTSSLSRKELFKRAHPESRSHLGEDAVVGSHLVDVVP